MKARLTLAAMFLTTALFTPASPVAAAQYTCPDGMMPTLVIVDPSLAKKDRNANFIVCAKDLNGDTKGGPDDRLVIDDILG